ncbi:hypothetical protein LV779_07860 [Streptomyces thinghirensis]|nr:hypothetical protein [Streptomyces thinghirensis]
MSYEEVTHLIRHHRQLGHGQFLEELREAKDAAGADGLIGQFGVGFYSGFMVADEVTLVTRRAGENRGHPLEVARRGHVPPWRRSPKAPQGDLPSLLHLAPRTPANQLHDLHTPSGRSRRSSSGTSGLHPVAVIRLLPKPAEGRAPEAVRGRDAHLGMKGTVGPPARRGVRRRVPRALRAHRHDWREPLETIRLQAEGAPSSTRRCSPCPRAPHDLFTQGLPARRTALREARLHHGRLRNCCSRTSRFVKGVVGAQDLSLNSPARSFSRTATSA